MLLFVCLVRGREENFQDTTLSPIKVIFGTVYKKKIARFAGPTVAFIST